MGLDNGIVIRHRSPIDFSDDMIEYLSWFDRNERKRDGMYETDLCYWRKCWNVRRDILTAFSERFVDNGKTKLYADDIGKVMDVLRNFNESNWEYPEETIWEWYDEDEEGNFFGMSYHLDTDLKVLSWLEEYITSNKENVEEIYFYDSY